MIATLLRLRLVLFILTLVTLGLLVLFGREVQYDQSLESFFADNDPAVVAYREASDLFVDDQFVFVAYEDPDLLTPDGIARVAQLAEDIREANIEGVVSVQSLDELPVFWRLDDSLFLMERLNPLLRRGMLRAIELSLQTGIAGSRGIPTIDSAIRVAGDNPEALSELQARVTSHPLLSGTFVDQKGTTTSLLVRLEPAGSFDAKQSIENLRSIALSFQEDHGFGRQPAVVGPPVLLADGFKAIEVDGRRLATVGMLLIGLVTLSATRSLWWSLVPILAGWTVWLATETILAILGLRLSLSSGPLVAQIIVLTMPAASHLALHFRDDLRRLNDRRQAAIETIRAVRVPIFWCAVTATIGYGALATSNVVPIRQFGTVLGIATAIASIWTLMIAPFAMLPPIRLELPVKAGSTSRIGRLMTRLTELVLQYPRPIVFVTLVVSLSLSVGIGFLNYESDYIKAFKPSAQVVQDYRFVENRLGGIGLVGVVLPVDGEVTPELITRLQALDDSILNLGLDDPEIASVSLTTSLATVLDPDRRLEKLDPESQKWFIDTKLRLIDASPQAGLLRNFWNASAGRTRIMVRLSESQPALEKMRTFEEVGTLGGNAFAAASEPESIFLTGLSHLLTQTTRGVIETQWTTFTVAAISILVMLTIAFRNPLLAVLAILPTLLAVGFVLGLMGFTGVKLDIATALVASVALGLSVDDTFHCLLQFRRVRRQAGFREALFESYKVTGPGVLLSSLAVALGFSVLTVSEFVPFITFGLMVAIATAGSSLGNLVLLPACLSLFEQWSQGKRWDHVSTADSANTTIG